jgi:hypothetical protein
MEKEFTPVSIDDADIYLKAEYGEYCAEKFSLGEIPMHFEQWQIANNEMKD